MKNKNIYLCGLLEERKQIGSTTEECFLGTVESRDIPLYICPCLSFFLKWEGLYKVSESIDAYLGVTL